MAAALWFMVGPARLRSQIYRGFGREKKANPLVMTATLHDEKKKFGRSRRLFVGAIVSNGSRSLNGSVYGGDP